MQISMQRIPVRYKAPARLPIVKIFVDRRGAVMNQQLPPLEGRALTI